jgi:hypothetical protein
MATRPLWVRDQDRDRRTDAGWKFAATTVSFDQAGPTG